MSGRQPETAVMERRFSGLARLYGAKGAQRIRSAHAVVVGLGGVGSWAAEALARSGVARLTLIDLDHIAESNINRQVHAIEPSVGQSKVEAMRQRIALINPLCQVHAVDEFVDADNWPQIAGIQPGNDMPLAIFDACDQVRAKTAMAAWALEQGAHFIAAGAAGGKRHAHRVEIEDLSVVTHDPLLAQLRYRIRKSHGASRTAHIGLACVFSREPVMQPDAVLDMAETAAGEGTASDGSLNCHGYGSVVTVTATFGLCAAGWLLDRVASGCQRLKK